MPRKWERKTGRGSWSEESLKLALKYIEEGNSIKSSSKKYGIPFSTLQERKKKCMDSKPHLGRNATFTPDQEHALAERIKTLANLFYGPTATDVRKVAYEYAVKNEIPHRFSDNERLAGKDWLYGFLKRNPSVSIRKPEATSINRITGFNREEVNKFYDNLESVLSESKFTPDRIFNADETGITTVQDPGKILATKGKKQVGSVTSWERGKLVTVMCAMSASGIFIPPLFIYPRQRMSPLLKKDGPPCAIYECSKRGWTNEDIFVKWLQHFIEHSKATKERPVILILDNHNSHTSLASFELCKANGVIMVSLPPHCSHRLQPLDVTFYSTLKAAFKRECDTYMKTNRLVKITPYDLAGLFNKAYSRVATIAVAVSGFKTTGIYPFDRTLFTDDDFAAADAFCVNQAEALPALENDDEAGVETNNGNQPDLSNRPNHEDQQSTCKDLNTTNDDFNKSNCSGVQNVSFEELIPLPSTSGTQKTRNIAKKHSEILTSTPKKLELQLAMEKKKIKELRAENAKLKKHARELFKNATKSEGCVKGVKTNRVSKKKIAPNLLENRLGLKKMTKVKQEKEEIKTKKSKKQTIKRKLKKEVSSDSEDEATISEKELCDDDDMDDMPIDPDENLCFICEEFGKDGEEWFRCVNCGLWIHALCSGADSPENFLCDRCLRHV